MKNKRFVSLVVAVAILFDAALPAGGCFTASAETVEDTSLMEVEGMEEKSDENQLGKHSSDIEVFSPLV